MHKSPGPQRLGSIGDMVCKLYFGIFLFSPLISSNVNIIMLSSVFLRLSPCPATVGHGHKKSASNRLFGTSFLSRFHQDEAMRHQEVTLPVELQCCCCVVAGCLDCFLPQHRSYVISSKRNRPRSSWRRQRVGLYRLCCRVNPKSWRHFTARKSMHWASHTP